MSNAESVLVFEALSAKRDLSGFSCGNPQLDDYIHKYALKSQNAGLNRTFLGMHSTRPPQAVGYYTLAAGRVAFEDIPDNFASGMPRYPIPTSLIAKLGIDHRVQRQGHGATMLIDALRKIVVASRVIGVRAVEVDAIDDAARGCYQRFGFEAFKDNSRHLFLPMDTVQKIIAEAGEDEPATL